MSGAGSAGSFFHSVHSIDTKLGCGARLWFFGDSCCSSYARTLCNASSLFLFFSNTATGTGKRSESLARRSLASGAKDSQQSFQARAFDLLLIRSILQVPDALCLRAG